MNKITIRAIATAATAAITAGAVQAAPIVERAHKAAVTDGMKVAQSSNSSSNTSSNSSSNSSSNTSSNTSSNSSSNSSRR